jgi:hypothetical protein
MTDIELADHKRDRRLRRRLLLMLNAARVRPESGWCGGQLLYDLVDTALPSGQRFEDEDHLLGLLRDLISAAYAEERDDRTRESQRASLEFTSYRITSKGTALVTEAIEPDPLVEDGRRRKPSPPYSGERAG